MDSAPEKVALVGEFLARICTRNAGHVAIVGSSTVLPGSPDRIMNDVAGTLNVPMVRVDQQGYLLEDGGNRLSAGTDMRLI